MYQPNSWQIQGSKRKKRGIINGNGNGNGSNSVSVTVNGNGSGNGNNHSNGNGNVGNSNNVSVMPNLQAKISPTQNMQQRYQEHPSIPHIRKIAQKHGKTNDKNTDFNYIVQVCKIL